MPNLAKLGHEAEDRAAQYLLDKGYTIVTRRYKAKHGEIDIVALDGELLVFVEVKYRRGNSSWPEAAVDDAKIERLAKAALEYATAFGCLGMPTRFDLIAVTPNSMRHHPDAFRPR